MVSFNGRRVWTVSSIIVFSILTGFLIRIFQQVSSAELEESFHVLLGSFHIFLGCLVITAFIGGGMIASSFLLICSILVTFLSVVKTNNLFYCVYVPYYVLIWLVLSRDNKKKNELVVMNEVYAEKNFEENNNLRIKLEEKSKALDSFLYKYASYFNLRKVIDDFSSTLQINEVSEIIAKDTFEIVGKGDFCLLYLIDLHEDSLSLSAAISQDKRQKVKRKKGDVFDQWVLKHRQQLLVSDVEKDFRFSHHKTPFNEECLSTIVTPLMHESRVVGTLRINSNKQEEFNTQDLRVLSIIGGIASAAVSNALLYQKTVELAIRDSLTGLYVHRYFKERLKEEHRRALISNTPLTLIMADLDDFKRYNDRFGHAVGDIILKSASDILGEVVKENGIVARYGGEEFAVLLPNISKHDGKLIAEEICATIAKEEITIREISTQITISMGVSNLPNDTLDGEELIKIADTYLYEAKKQGKNRVACSDAAPGV